MNVDNDNSTIKEIIKEGRDYFDTSIQLAKLKAVNKASSFVSTLVSFIVIPLLVLVVIILLAIGVSVWLGKLLGAYHFGFFITGAFLSLVIVLIFKFRDKWLKKPVANSLIENILQ